MNVDRPVLISARGLGRRYAGVSALRGVDLDIRGGEVLAIVGENGAGKSTLLKLLSGVVAPSEGSLKVADADAGIALVHQELNLAENLDVAGNIFLGREPRTAGFLNLRAMRDDARRWLSTVGLHIDPATPCGALPIAHRQLVEIAKALSANARILILDEPTSSLTAPEVERLLAIMADLRARGTAVVFVSHHLDEVLRIADRVVVLRDGAVTGTLARGDFDRGTLERLMVGRDLAPAARRAASASTSTTHHPTIRLRADAVVTRHHRRRAVSLQVRAGEVVGLAGLVGSGRTELLESIAGIVPHGGRVCLDGGAVAAGAVARTRAGIALVPEDRARNGILADEPVSTNVSLAWIDRHSNRGRIDAPGERTLVRSVVDRVLLRPADPARTVRTLSGGNQQKTVLGRWIAVQPAVLLLDEPTRGVDVGARAEIHAEVRRLADAGAAVLFASSELEEVLMLADRVLVMHDGGIAGELALHEATEEAIMHLATGGAA
jgi:ribose transport system ATP-binding protein